ncbi:MAG TPA: hypothetical protein VD859_14165 [Nocardioides sp.]|nr:hypothetical protein [Nocardioides sp.]
MQIEVEGADPLRFGDGSPVRAASAVTSFGGGLLVVQDDATHGAWFRGAEATAVRLLPPVEGLETFEELSGTKHLKPDLEAACPVELDGQDAVLLLGSGSSPRRMRWALLRLTDDGPRAAVADLTLLYDAVAGALGVGLDVLNLEGACVVGEALRWFNRGLPSAGLPSGSVDLDLAAALEAALGVRDPGTVPVTNRLRYELGEVQGVGLAVTDAVALPDGAILLSAAAEDSPNPRDDAPVVGSALVRLDEHAVQQVTSLPLVGGQVCKVEGLMLLDASPAGTRLLAVVDGDDPCTPSLAIRLRVG